MNSKIISLYKSKLSEINKLSQARNLVTTSRENNLKVTRNKKQLISFSCNDYLGLSKNKEVIKESIKATKQYGSGSGASRLVSGNNPLYEELENLLAKYKKSESACVFGSGFLTNAGIIPALTSSKDLLLYDELSHSSTNIGLKLSSAKYIKFKHNDANHLESLLKKYRKKYFNCFLFTEGVFSMDGDRGNIKELALLANKYDASIILDDAHGFGVLGKGRGSLYEHNPTPEVLIQMGTLSKAIGSYGGFVTAPKTIIKLLHSKARSLIYTTGLPPGTLAASLKALQIIIKNPEVTKKPYKYAKLFCERAGLPIPESSIVSKILYDENNTIKASKLYENYGYYIGAIRPPTVPKNTSRLRFTFSSEHKKKDVIELAHLTKILFKD
ncbi:MAG: 8-amino-7-oxononanoate synthase [Pelagibacterales bacterium]|nr:8-amino-7-oxononanoate synthase [Pelagibacterales bacterium]PPR16562.1 MAG: 8-amino-7-oxononanoate synthase [Alphaproteobacteria bacterium MarineAlpha9_Bin3]|tara:strand:- start:9504 stop:10658 length:1155 start_codon:yes stop_codon:yes gene_type:complete